jgi:hypothetical protein
MSGVVWGTVLTESRGGDDPYNVLLGRAENGIQYGLAFGSAAAASEASRFALSRNRLLGTASQGKFLTQELPLVAATGGLSGAGTGIVNANLESLIHEHRLATAGEMGHRALSEGLMGMSFAAAHQTHSHYTRFAPLQSAELNKLKWIETTDLNNPTMQKFYQQNQLPGLRQPLEVLATETKNFQLETFDGYIDPISRHTTARVTRFPNDRIAAISIDQKIHDNGPRLRWERRSLFVGQDVFAPELAGTKLPAEHIKLNQKRLNDWLVQDESNGGIRAEEFRNRATIRPLPWDGDVPLTQLDVEVRNAYGDIGGRQIDPKTFPFEVTFGRATAEGTPVRAEVIFNSFEHEYFPTIKLDCREGDQYYKAIKEIAHEMPSGDPKLSAAYAEFRKFNEYPSIRIEEQSPPSPTSTTQLQDFHNSRYSEILGEGRYGFATGITFDANAGHLRPDSSDND